MMTKKEVSDIVEVANYVLSEPWRFASGDEILAKGIIDLAKSLEECQTTVSTLEAEIESVVNELDERGEDGYLYLRKKANP